MVDLGKKVELFSTRVPLETFRQWVELIIGIYMLVWFGLCALKMKKTLKSWFILDTLLILLLELRVALFLIYEFLLPSRVLPYIADNIFILVLIMIFYSFSVALYPLKTNRLWNRRNYIIGIFIILTGTLAYSLITFKKSFYCDNDDTYSGEEINVVIIQFVELSVSTINLVFSYTLRKYYTSSAIHHGEDPESQLREMLHQEDDVRQSKRQLIIIGYGMFIFSVLRTIRAMVGHYLTSRSVNYVCQQGMYLIPLTNTIAFYLILKLLLNLIPTIMLHYVIYYVPKKAGKIAHIKIHDDDITLSSSRSRRTIEEDEAKTFNDDSSNDAYLLDKNYDVSRNTHLQRHSDDCREEHKTLYNKTEYMSTEINADLDNSCIKEDQNELDHYLQAEVAHRPKKFRNKKQESDILDLKNHAMSGAI